MLCYASVVSTGSALNLPTNGDTHYTMKMMACDIRSERRLGEEVLIHVEVKVQGKAIYHATDHCQYHAKGDHERVQGRRQRLSSHLS